MVSHDPVLFELIDHVAVITLNRPEVRNAMNRELRQALMEGLHRVREEDEIRVAIITGAGRTFSAGADLKERAQVGRAGRRQCRLDHRSGPGARFCAITDGKAVHCSD